MTAVPGQGNRATALRDRRDERATLSGLVFAARELGAELAGLPELEVRGLQDDDARALLESASGPGGRYLSGSSR